jgi:ABC-type branched-subunit amino acid transport system ATPase component
MLRLDALTKDFGGLRAVDHCSFEVPTHTIFGLIGPNGSGKSTIFNMITGFLEPTSGHVFFKNQDITNKKPDQINHLNVARTFQLVKVFRNMTVMENLLLAPKRQSGENLLWALVQPRRMFEEEKENTVRARALLDLIGLREAENALAGSLSYAEQKMVEISRAMMTEPEIILLDEPASGINPTLMNRILNYIRELRDRQGKTFLIVEHDMRVVMNLCERIVVLNYGRKIAEGTPSEISCNPLVIDAYLGV